MPDQLNQSSPPITSKATQIYLALTALVICGLATATVTATKVIHLGINFPFSNLAFSIFTYPIVDTICELWGKNIARQTAYTALACQILIMLLLQLAVVMPYAPYWQGQHAFTQTLAVSGRTAVASLLAFLLSQILDIIIYQKIKLASQGKWLWLRSNVSTFIGQIIDSAVFISIVFYGSTHVLNIILGSVLIKILLSITMTPVVYALVLSINHHLNHATLAFKAPHQ